MRLPRFLQITEKTMAGDSKFCFIRINPKYKDDKGLLAHEEEHVRQWYIVTFSLFIPYLICAITVVEWPWHILAFGWCGVMYNLACTFSRRVRLKAEVLAYRVQLSYSPKKALRFAEFLAGSYDLNITTAKALELLKAP